MAVNILLITESEDYKESIGEIIKSYFSNVFYAKNEQEALDILQESYIDIVLLGMETVDKSEVLYLHLLRSDTPIDQRSSYIMLLANKNDVQQAFDCCQRNIFHDYFIASPVYDLPYIIIRLKEISQLIKYQPNQKLATLSASQVDTFLNNTIFSKHFINDIDSENLHKLISRLEHGLKKIEAATPNTNSANYSNKLQHVPPPEQEVKPPTSENTSLLSEMVSGEYDHHKARIDQLSTPLTKPEGGILIIHSVIKQLKAINKLFALNGYVTYPCLNCKQAFSHLLESKPTLILIDLGLTDQDALGFINKLRKHTQEKDISIIILANQTERAKVLQAADLGIQHVIIKPISKELLLNKINSSMAIEDSLSIP